MNTKITTARASAYAALAAIFRGRSSLDMPARAWDAPAGTLLTALKVLDKGLASTWYAAVETGVKPDSLTYNRLFVGPMPPLAHPYESVYRTPDGRLMGEATMQAIRAHAAAGLSLADDSRDLPDHISVELEFMAFLIEEEAAARVNGNEALAVSYLSQQAAFLRDHLIRWIPHFCHRVTEADGGGFYGETAVTLAAFIVHDLDLATAARQSMMLPAETVTTPPVTRPVGIWAVGLRPERRFISCTLCGICAQVCRPDALCLVQDEGEIELVFDPACCDGCGYCVKYCPERILRVWETAVNGHHPRQEQLAASTIVPCAGCGTPLAAEAMLNRILERFRRQQGDPADEAAMYLCHVCKVGAAAVT